MKRANRLLSQTHLVAPPTRRIRSNFKANYNSENLTSSHLVVSPAQRERRNATASERNRRKYETIFLSNRSATCSFAHVQRMLCFTAQSSCAAWEAVCAKIPRFFRATLEPRKVYSTLFQISDRFASNDSPDSPFRALLASRSTVGVGALSIQAPIGSAPVRIAPHLAHCKFARVPSPSNCVCTANNRRAAPKQYFIFRREIRNETKQKMLT